MDAVNFLNLEYVFLRIVDLFKNFDIIAVLNWIIHFIDKIRPIAVILTLFMAFVIIYSHIRLKQIYGAEAAKLEALKAKDAAAQIAPDASLNEKWAKVQAHISSTNPSDWRLAILEADIMLDEVLEKRGYQGDSIGDKLKSVDKSDFLTLNLAWEAHKVRNQIAHGGSDFLLSERDAKRTIDLYKKVFDEFYHI